MKRRTDEKVQMKCDSAVEKMKENSIIREIFETKDELKEKREHFHPKLRREVQQVTLSEKYIFEQESNQMIT